MGVVGTVVQLVLVKSEDCSKVNFIEGMVQERRALLSFSVMFKNDAGKDCIA